MCVCVCVCACMCVHCMYSCMNASDSINSHQFAAQMLSKSVGELWQKVQRLKVRIIGRGVGGGGGGGGTGTASPYKPECSLRLTPKTISELQYLLDRPDDLLYLVRIDEPRKISLDHLGTRQAMEEGERERNI